MDKKKTKIKTSIFVLVIVAIFGVGTLWALVGIINGMTRFYNRPEQSAQVEVVGKRIRVSNNFGKRYSFTSYSNIVAYKFPDGLVKELEIDTGKFSSAYDSIHEGDTGILIYKEIKNIEKKYKNNDSMRYDGRFFISFERDSKYGELKIESTEQQFETWHFILLGAVVVMWLFFAVFLVKGTKYALKYIRQLAT